MAIKPYFQETTGFETFLKATEIYRIIISRTKNINQKALLRSSSPIDEPIDSKRISVIPDEAASVFFKASTTAKCFS